jgi:hypothetical protein
MTGTVYRLPGSAVEDADQIEPAGSIWLQQPEETDRQYAALRAYLDQPAGRRSLARLGDTLAGRESTERVPAHGTLKLWSSRWSWVERARAYDAHQRRLADIARVHDAIETRSQVWRMARIGLARAFERLNEGNLTAAEAIRLLDVSARLALVTIGEPDSRVAFDVPADAVALGALLETDAAEALIHAARAMAAGGA